MKAIVYESYGSPDVLRYKDVQTPLPANDEVRVRIQATGVNPVDRHLMRAEPFFIRFMAGLFKPKNNILGVDIAGIVDKVGKGVSEFKPGDRVFGCVDDGGFAEYVCCKPDKIAILPDTISFVSGAGVYVGASTALQSLRGAAKVEAGQEVLIDGASGGVGTFAVQIAKMYGAVVTAVCGTQNMEMVRSLCADEVIDYTKVDFTEQSKRYDVVYCTIGQHSLSEYRRVLKPEGMFVASGGAGRQVFTTMLLGKLLSSKQGKKFRFVMAQQTKEDLIVLGKLLSAGTIKTVIDRCYPLAETPDAIRYLEQGHAIGKVIITMEP